MLYLAITFAALQGKRGTANFLLFFGKQKETSQYVFYLTSTIGVANFFFVLGNARKGMQICTCQSVLTTIQCVVTPLSCQVYNNKIPLYCSAGCGRAKHLPPWFGR